MSSLCSFQGARGQWPLPFAAAVPSPPDRLQQPPVGVGRFSHLGLRFLNFLRTLKTIQTRDFAQPFSLAFQSDALASLSLCLSYINRSYSVSLDSLAVLRTDCSIPIDLRSMSFHVSGFSFLPRKEVIQPHLPIRLPCYDFTPVIGLTFGS